MNKMKAVWGALTLGAAAAIPGAAFAQAGSEEIVVTGSRLATAANAPQPILTVTTEELAKGGETSLADALEQLPALQVSNNLEQSVRDGAVTGRTGLNLRGLGQQRTLVLVNGRRHVSGFAGTAAVDTSTIPSSLVERIEVVTGGASAVYGSDAVTGVVNFILKDDFDGEQLDLQVSSSDQGDGQAIFASFLAGRNFAGGKGNVTIAVEYETREGIRRGDRDTTANNALAGAQANPALRFQAGDPVPAGQTALGVIGRTILLGSGAPRFANTSQALIDRATNASAFLIAGNTRFAISATPGLISFDPFSEFGPRGASTLETVFDLDSNGVDDCTQSRVGQQTEGFLGGCWIIDRNTGAVRPFQDGLIADNINQFGGDGAEQYTDGDSLTPDLSNLSVNLVAKYEINKLLRTYAEVKAVQNTGEDYAFYNTFDDTIILRTDNPFIPTQLRNMINQEIAAQTLADPTYDPSLFQVIVNRDHTDLLSPLATNTRNQYRAVFGVGGDLTDHWSYDLSFNYGRTEETVETPTRLRDRFFAAFDATTDGSGNPACRIAVDGTLPIASFLDPQQFSPIAPVSFTPSQCRPVNLFGIGNSSKESLAFLNYIAKSEATIEQTVAQGTIIGDTTGIFELPGGPIGVAFGAEYREEKSDFQPDVVNTNGNAFEQRRIAPVQGSFDVKEVFVEFALPLLGDMPFAETLNLTAAARTGEYSTIGDVSSWKTDLVWAPVEDIRFRAGLSETIRAPNIVELFLAPQNVNSNPRDPCLPANINLGPSPANRLANCTAQFGANLADLKSRTAQFAGQRLGNPNLSEEISETLTYGFVLRPRFVPGLTVTVDWWDIKIEDAIATIEQNDLVAACYDAPSLANQFCAQFGRELSVAPSAPNYGVINSIRVQDLNFSRFEAAGVDFSATYVQDISSLGLAARELTLRVVGTQLNTNETFPFPSEPNRSNPSLGELDYPELSLTGSASLAFEKLELNWFANYQSEQALRGVEIETVEDWTPNTGDAIWVHDVSASYKISDNFQVFAGVNNVFEEEPYLGETSIPVSALGRTVFIRLSAKR